MKTLQLLSFVSAATGFCVTTTVPTRSSSSLSAATTATSWAFSVANDNDVDLVGDLINRKCEFDRSINGEPESKLTPCPGERLSSLFPELPGGQILMIGEEDNDEEPIGFAMYAYRYHGLDTPPMLWLEDIYVDPSRRSAGAGAALMDELAEEASQRSCTHLSWVCDQRNAKGLQFYNRIGAEVTARKGDLIEHRWQPWK